MNLSKKNAVYVGGNTWHSGKIIQHNYILCTNKTSLRAKMKVQYLFRQYTTLRFPLSLVNGGGNPSTLRQGYFGKLPECRLEGAG